MHVDTCFSAAVSSKMVVVVVVVVAVLVVLVVVATRTAHACKWCPYRVSSSQSAICYYGRGGGWKVSVCVFQQHTIARDSGSEIKGVAHMVTLLP